MVSGVLGSWNLMCSQLVQDGPLIRLCLDFLREAPQNVRALARNERGGTMNESTRVRLQRFISGVRCVLHIPPFLPTAHC
jgi:hypothetical protein